MVKKSKTTEPTSSKTLFVKVKDDANTDIVKYGDIRITKSQFVEVDEGVQNHRAFDMLTVNTSNSN